MKTVQTATITPDSNFTSFENQQVYNGLDCCVTVEVFEALRAQRPQGHPIYDFERALQAPYLEIMNRGWLIDQTSRYHASQALRARQSLLQNYLDQMADAVWGRPINPRSPKQLQEFFFSAMRLPEVYISQKGVRKLSTNREALEKLEVYLHPRPLIACILAIRDIEKQLDVFETEIDPDSRFRTSYNIAGTESGRPSSSQNAFGTGGNAQNIAPGLRHVFVADPGFKLVAIDLEQVEARDVGFFIGCLFGDWKFLDNCESGDLHTNNAKLIWPGLAWTGNPKADREIAEQQFYREFSHRDMAKRGGHLSNYMGTAWTAARSLKVPLGIMEEFQARYVRGRFGHKSLPDVEPAFPGIAKWWEWTATQLQTNHLLVTPFGRERYFFGRPNDDTTLREAIAFLPQSTTADRMNLGLWRVWKREPKVQLLGQGFDSIMFQVPEGPQFDDTVGRCLEHIRVELRSPSGRSYVVPGEAKVGWNWGARVTHEDQEKARRQGRRPPPLNLDGLVKWKPGNDNRARSVGLARIANGGA